MSSSCAGVHLPRHISLRAGERRGRGLSVTGSIWGGLLKRYHSINQNKESKVGTQGVEKIQELENKMLHVFDSKMLSGKQLSYYILFKIYLYMVTSQDCIFVWALQIVST